MIAIPNFINVSGAQRNGCFLEIDFSRDRESCEALVDLWVSTKALIQQAEGFIFWAGLAALEYRAMENFENGTRIPLLEKLKTEVEKHLNVARSLCKEFPAQTNTVSPEIDDMGRLRHKAGYTSQMRKVVVAMQAEFSGAGRWYRCENGHPFTVGECGLPMKSTRCPQCNAPVGGQNHESAAGVQHTGDMKWDFGTEPWEFGIEDD